MNERSPLKVGQVLFVVPKEQLGLVPVQVIEAVTKHTLTGKEVSYVVQTTTNKRYDLTSFAEEVFESAQKARAALIEKSTQAIVSLVDTAVRVASVGFKDHQEPAKLEEKRNAKKEQQRDQSVAVVSLSDGSTARVLLPEDNT